MPAPASSANQSTVNNQKENRTKYRCNKSPRFACVVPSDSPSEKTSERGSRKADKHGDDHASGITTGHEELRKSSDD
jgi:hypothetical protein